MLKIIRYKTNLNWQNSSYQIFILLEIIDERKPRIHLNDILMENSLINKFTLFNLKIHLLAHTNTV